MLSTTTKRKLFNFTFVSSIGLARNFSIFFPFLRKNGKKMHKHMTKNSHCYDSQWAYW